MNETITPESILTSVVHITEQRSQQHLEDCLVDTLFELGGLAFCGICHPLRTSTGIFIEFVAQRGQGGQDDASEIHVSDRLLHECLESGQIGTDRRDGGLRRVMPITDDGGYVLALLVTVTPEGQDEQLGLIEGFAAIYRNYLSILRDAARDTLTGLKNRKTFDENLGRIVASARHLDMHFAGNRRGGHMGGEHHWLGIIDIDHFKRVNDTFGHVFGDEVLLLLAALMRKAFRTEDMLFRFGGEEFVVLLAPTTFEAAQAVFDRFRSIVAGFTFPQAGTVTVSIGFVRICPEDLPSVVIGRADRALYFAKEHGRNQVRSYEQLLDGKLLAEEETPESPVELF